MSAALVSGCSNAGGVGPSLGGIFGKPAATTGAYGQNSAPSARCRVPYPQAPIPPGCHPSEVTVGPAGPQGASFAGGFPQQPQFGEPAAFPTPQYATGGFGSQAGGNAHAALHRGGTAALERRPRFRGSLDLGLERSLSGNAIDNTVFPTTPFAAYDPLVYAEGSVAGSVADGQTTRLRYVPDSRLRNTPQPWDTLTASDVSFSDSWSVPASVGVGGEFILSDHATLFARAGYARAEGNGGSAASIEATVFKETTVETYDDAGNPTGATTTVEFKPEQTISEVSYDFSDMERIDLQAGARLYLDPVAGRATGRTVTPFFGASAGASRYNAASYTLDQRQLGYRSVFEADAPFYYDLDVPGGFDVDNDPATPGVARVDLYEAQWVPSGALNAGVEWQVTPKTALALETGVRVEGAREYTNGQSGDARVSIPLTLRGSFNF
ncbi:hypothetical protein [uncultured Algimonas sp.]|uniref:hypothetical protein n=1 Tax=uncultured Algimonas sp. TaxID=1547920 RepID=UPI002620EAD5|nr:hypothetical protein [uncultured Algimonas sp.]